MHGLVIRCHVFFFTDLNQVHADSKLVFAPILNFIFFQVPVPLVQVYHLFQQFQGILIPFPGSGAEFVKLDVTNPDDAKAAAQAAVDKFGRIDVLVNNAGNFIAGFFEEISPDDFRAQVETNLFGPLNVTRAVLPVMRSSAPVWSSRSPRPAASSARSSAPHTRPRSSASKAGSNRWHPR